MLTRELVSFLKREASDYSRELLYSLINEVQNIIFNRPIAEWRYLDPTTGKDPQFTTTAGTLSYQATFSVIPSIASGVTIFRVEDVYTGSFNDDGIYPSNYRHNYQDDYKSIPITASLATAAIPASFIFSSDPGAVNVNVRCFKGPVQITSEQIEMTIPMQWHLPIVYEGVMAIIERTQNGKGDRYINWYNNILPEFYWSMNRNYINQSGMQYKGGF